MLGESLNTKKEKYYQLYEEYLTIKQNLKNNYGDDQEKARRLDLLNYQFNEIELAKLKIGEEEELEIQKKKIQNAEKLQSSINSIDAELNENVISGISNCIRNLEKIEDCGETYQNKLADLKSIYYDIQEMARDISYMKEETEFDENTQNEIENRLDLIYSLKRKYGNSISVILNYQASVKEEINKIQNIEEVNEKLKQNLKKIEEQMLIIAKEITAERKCRNFI